MPLAIRRVASPLLVATLVVLLALCVLLRPAAAPAQAPPTCTPPTQLGIVYVLDDSGSMASTDRDKLRGVGAGLGLREQRAGIAAAVRFASTAGPIFAPTDLATANIAALDQQIQSGLRSSGGTNFDEAFTAAQAQLAAMPATVDKKAVVFLSDGDASGAYSADLAIANAGIPIVTIGFGSRTSDDLRQIATRSGGVYQHVGSAGEVQGAMARSVAFLNCQAIDAPETVDMAPGSTRDFPFAVTAGTQAFNALATWGDGQVTARLIRPDGSVMGPGATAPNETFEEQASFVRATSAQPAAGGWKVRLVAGAQNPSSVRVSIDLIGDGGARLDHPLEARPLPAGPGCETEVTATGRVAWSRCFRRITGGWQSAFPVRIGGIDVVPRRGSSISILREGRLVARDAQLSVFSRGPMLPGGRLVLDNGSFELPLQRTRLLPLRGTSELGRRIGGLPIQTQAGLELGWTTTGATLKASLSLGRDFAALTNPLPDGTRDNVISGSRGSTLRRGFGLDVELKTANATGLTLERVGGRIDAGRIYGSLAVENMFLTYEPQTGRWNGGAQINPFRASLSRYGLPSLRAEVGINTNPVGFGRLALTVSNINKPIGPYIFLQKLGGSVQKDPPPFQVSGQAGFSAGPRINIPGLGPLTALEIDGSATYKAPLSLSGTGAMKVLGQGVANATAEVNLGDSSGSFAGDANFDFAGNGLAGRLEGFLRGGDFQFYGRVDLRVAGQTAGGGEGFVGSRGAGACRRGWGPDFGWSFDWARGFPRGINVMGYACDFGGLLIPSQPRQAGGEFAIAVGAGSPGELFEIVAPGGQPDVAIQAPTGQVYDLRPDRSYIETPEIIAIRDLAASKLYVVLNEPARGQWRIAPFPGSTPLAPISKARALPKPNLRASLRRVSGGRLQIRYTARAIRGQRIRFVERGPKGLSRTIRSTTRGRGTITFRPAVGSGGVRIVDAIITQDGRARDTLQAGRFRTGTRRPSRPASVRVRRSGRSDVRISWRGVRGASTYTVALRLRDGRRIESTLTRTRRSVLLRGIARNVSGTASVRAVTRNGYSSAQRTARLRTR
jgi:hypothetical protein